MLTGRSLLYNLTRQITVWYLNYCPSLCLLVIYSQSSRDLVNTVSTCNYRETKSRWAVNTLTLLQSPQHSQQPPPVRNQKKLTPPCLLTMNFNVTLHLCLSLPSDLSLQVLWLKPFMDFSSTTPSASPANLIRLDCITLIALWTVQTRSPSLRNCHTTDSKQSQLNSVQTNFPAIG